MTPVVLAVESGHGAATVGPIRTALMLVLVAVGTFFLLVGTVGLLRLPNVYNRMHATSKATTLGVSGIALAGFVYFGPGSNGLVTLVTIVFLYLTAPTGAHVISRAASRMGIDFLSEGAWPREARPGPMRAGDDADTDTDADGTGDDASAPASDD